MVGISYNLLRKGVIRGFRVVDDDAYRESIVIIDE